MISFIGSNNAGSSAQRSSSSDSDQHHQTQPQEQSTAPPVMCMVMFQPGWEDGTESPPAHLTRVQYFHDIEIIEGSEDGRGGGSSSGHSSEHSVGLGASTSSCQCPPEDFNIAHPLQPPRFSAKAVHAAPSSSQGHGSSSSSGGRSGAQVAEALSCRISVSPESFEVTAELPGNQKMDHVCCLA